MYGDGGGTGMNSRGTAQNDCTSLAKLYQDDAVLRKLDAAVEKLQERVKKRKILIARKNGFIGKSSKRLRCLEHGGKLAVSGAVEGSDTIISWMEYTTAHKEFNTYACAESAHRVEAYDCPVCGVVLGEYAVETYKLKSKSLKQQGAVAGSFITCSVCGTLIGYGAEGAFSKVKIE